MVAVDTNIIVRLLTNDDARKARKVLALFGSEEIYIGKTVLLETEWVLRYSYALSQASIVAALRNILGLPKVSVETPEQVAIALAWCEKGLDFADALHLAGSYPVRRFATLDKKLAKRGRAITDVDVLAL